MLSVTMYSDSLKVQLPQYKGLPQFGPGQGKSKRKKICHHCRSVSVYSWNKKDGQCIRLEIKADCGGHLSQCAAADVMTKTGLQWRWTQDTYEDRTASLGSQDIAWHGAGFQSLRTPFVFRFFEAPLAPLHLQDELYKARLLLFGLSALMNEFFFFEMGGVPKKAFHSVNDVTKTAISGRKTGLPPGGLEEAKVETAGFLCLWSPCLFFMPLLH